MGRYVLGSKQFVAAPQTIDLSAIPAKEAGGNGFVKLLILDVLCSSITTTAGGTTNPIDLHNIIQQVKVDDGKTPWGPVVLPGQTLSEHDFLSRGEPWPFSNDINGDNSIAPSTSGATRRFQLVYDYSEFGDTGEEFMPPSAALRTGKLTFSMQLPPFVTAGNLTLTLTAYVVTMPQAKISAKSRIQTFPTVLASKQFNLGMSGMLLSWFFEASANIVAGDLTNVTLTADGEPVMNQADVLSLRGVAYHWNPEVTTTQMLRHFCDPVGGTTPRATPVFPNMPGRKMQLSKCPTATTFSALIVGALTLANYTSIATIAEELTDAEVGKQWVAQGAKPGTMPNAGNVRHHSANGNPVVNARIKGYVPHELADPQAVKSAA